jgi:hypothetical protein
LWIKEWKVERLVDALKLSRASGIPIEKFAGGIIEAQQSKETRPCHPLVERRGGACAATAGEERSRRSGIPPLRQPALEVNVNSD